MNISSNCNLNKNDLASSKVLIIEEMSAVGHLDIDSKRQFEDQESKSNVKNSSGLNRTSPMDYTRNYWV